MLYLSGIFIAFFLTFLLLTKKGKSSADFILGGWLLTIGVNLLTHYLFLTNQYTEYPSSVFLGFTLPLLYGPFLYLYVKKQTSPKPFSSLLLLHFLPFLMCNLLFLSFYTASFSERISIFKQEGRGFNTELLIRLYGIYISGIVYVAVSFLLLYRFRKNMVQQFSNTEKINFNWLLYLIIWMGLIWGLVLLNQNADIVYGAVAVFIMWLGYFGIKQVQVFNQPNSFFTIEESEDEADEVVHIVDSEDKKYQKSGLTEQSIEDIHRRLIIVLNEEKPFINPNLTLNELAELLKVHPNYLSQVINSRENKNFYELINEKRIEEFLNKIVEPESKQYTFLAIAFDCGFNSKTSFNRNFKKYTGVTPTEYQKTF
ncbi:AraC family transcriptional regulator [Chryseobacterium sp. T16E-39]|uniref:helix-turn-helix domain-containing protein n=1 Tax=Chryseobacterium sp. T16E-39 TaxID=2015076 RepID=UPI000B5B42D5|nr:helix-turn-helix domain-containing protein [Chryseobacterium sp. T16E-39]ASK30182.1 AraC family transcriptional regulator [Chryseobacterium sp. T16E-39]